MSGIQLPRTNSAADVARLVDFSKYRPAGTRAGVTGIASTDYAYVPAVEHIKRLNEELAIVVHVETREGATQGPDTLCESSFEQRGNRVSSAEQESEKDN